MKIAIIMVILLGLDGEFETKTTIEKECPDMNKIANHIEEMKVKNIIRDGGAVCIPAEFADGVPM